jgi:hypothetical protein
VPKDPFLFSEKNKWLSRVCEKAIFKNYTQERIALPESENSLRKAAQALGKCFGP